MSSINLSNTTKLAIGSDESTSAANRASRINSLVSRMFARANGGEGCGGLTSQIKASSTHALLKDDNNTAQQMVQTKLVNASIRSSSHSIAHHQQPAKPTKSGKNGKKAATFKPDASQSTLKTCVAKDGLSLKSNTIRMATTTASHDDHHHHQSNSDAAANVPRRNLFGIRLNHDQLKQDLKDMWRDQIEQQKQRWNFDFETLRPTTSAAAAAAVHHKGLVGPSTSTDQSERFKWTRVTYYTPGLPSGASSSMAPSGFDRAELFNNSQGDYEEEYESDTEQEEDDALAMPQFYKYQRRLKFNDEPSSRIKMMTITVSQAPARKSPTKPATVEVAEPKKSELSVEPTVESGNKAAATAANPTTFEPIFKLALKNSGQTSTAVVSEKKKAEANGSKKSVVTAKTTTIRRPKAIKRPQPQLQSQQPSLALSPSTQNLIITFSENRKDTLRSASSNHGTNAAPTAASTLTLTNTKVKLAAREGETAFVSTIKAVQPPNTETLKQQSLLDIFKQRKRRNTTVSSGKPSDDSENKSAESRSHSVAPSRGGEGEPSKLSNNKLAGRQSRITSSRGGSGTNAHNLRSHSSSTAGTGNKQGGYCKIFLRNGSAKVNN